MRLSVLDRLLLLGLLPAEGDITTLRIVRILRDELSFSEAEHATLHLQVKEGKATWDQDAAPTVTKDVEIGKKAWALIAGALTTLSASNKLTLPQLDLYERFVEEK